MLFQQAYMPAAFPLAEKPFLQKYIPDRRRLRMQELEKALLPLHLPYAGNSLHYQAPPPSSWHPQLANTEPSSRWYPLVTEQHQSQYNHVQQHYHHHQPSPSQHQYQPQQRRQWQQPSPHHHSNSSLHVSSIMIPPQSPTLTSYYHENYNEWLDHYYQSKRRQGLSSRVDLDAQKRQKIRHLNDVHNTSTWGNMDVFLPENASHHSFSVPAQLHGTDHFHVSGIPPQHHDPVSGFQQQHHYNAYGLLPHSTTGALVSSSSSSLSLPLPAGALSEEWRDNMLQYAHTLYATAPESPELLELLHTLHSRFPTHLPILLLLACVYFAYRDYDASLQYNHLILSYDPEYVEAMSNIGTTLQSMGRLSEAEHWWSRAVKLRPSYFDAIENLVGALCSPNAVHDQEKASHGSKAEKAAVDLVSRQREALAVCEYVEQYYFKEIDSAFSLTPPKELPHYQLSRLQNLFYAKGNLKYALSDVLGAQREYEKGLELAFGASLLSVANQLAIACGSGAAMEASRSNRVLDIQSLPLMLLQPEQALGLLQVVFASTGGILPGLVTLGCPMHDNESLATVQQTNQTTSTILLTLAKLYQDMMNPSTPVMVTAASHGGAPVPSLSLLLLMYYLSLALHPSPSTANNMGILMSNIPEAVALTALKLPANHSQPGLNGVVLAMQYYMYGLQIDPRHAHLYTNLGSLFKDMGHLNEAVSMYQKAVEYNSQFDVALANLGNAMKDMGRVQDSVQWYRRAVEINPDFVDAVCGLVNALMGVCDWRGRGGVGTEVMVDNYGLMLPKSKDPHTRQGWIGRVVDIVEKQLNDGALWGVGTLKQPVNGQGKLFGEQLQEIIIRASRVQGQHDDTRLNQLWRQRLQYFAEMEGKKNEGGWLIRLIERILRRLQRKWYIETYGEVVQSNVQRSAILITKEAAEKYVRPMIPSSLPMPPLPTVLPFHTFTYPLNARQVRLISHRNALRISHTTMNAAWVPSHVYPPPPPPSPRLKIGYISSDFNNHPLAHLMQSVFGFHDKKKYEVFCYATTASDNSPYRTKIAAEAEHFIDVSSWSHQQVVETVIRDGIHVLVNLNGYTKGAANEIFAARPSPVQCSFMGFAGTLGGGWCDWIIADPIVCPPEMVSGEVWRRRQKDQRVQNGEKGQKNGDFEGDIDPEEDTNDFVYTEKFIYMPHSYFVNDHKQGFREEDDEVMIKQHMHGHLSQEDLWMIEEDRRWKMRHKLFPQLPDDVVIFANFNQLYKLEPTTFHLWLRILERVPNSILWLLRFPPAGEKHLHRCAVEWAGAEVAQRVIFTDVAPKHIHIHRGRVADLFLDTPECNAHTTAADILWSGTPIVTYPKYVHKMCSRVGASIALATGYGDQMVATSEEQYEEMAVQYAQSLRYKYETDRHGKMHRRGHGPLMDLRKELFFTRERSRLFDTQRWTRNLEQGYSEAWRRWVTAEEFEDLNNKTSNASGCIWVKDPDD
ncbi:glycosyl transferase family 41-domain-containing protein [Radiomyces spectabilis]|uniref:glycosyl transferase family 41-domain-containing protein n=1 Tax=Radiomyces spectabilis TaxID=64574 RepID=UPI0022202E05|nr:glycosyl transferase family 41-domain-containing protein [Radiomyces spectabilis]KAI8391424.1 glycosyl transferase family 41-domain-containing protein [Radiomyces spectabilis]